MSVAVEPETVLFGVDPVVTLEVVDSVVDAIGVAVVLETVPMEVDPVVTGTPLNKVQLYPLKPFTQAHT